MKALSQATLVELARAGAVRGYTLHGRADGYVLSVQYGLHEAVLTAKRGGARRFARLDTALALLRTLRAAAVEVRLADAAPPPPAASRARLPRGAPPLSRPRCRSRSAAPRRAPPPCSKPSKGETWDAHDAERAFNFERHWAALLAGRRGDCVLIRWTWNGRHGTPRRRSQGSVTP
ncbi:hypothetical protein [Lysobacter enzymogenes]|uniref:Uncharacterized protein n=1 Tax=Lysobacter enzymogenes TaxID=69 RepID=A0AAU9AD96_LYSEN|nr:hypothetical protein [Lysobacter enzymogenes]BAV96651.1 hypothetical protein LEN_1164 [Lysobacter enzymogenes]